MKIYVIINEDFNEQDLQDLNTCNDNLGQVEVSGWITEDNLVIYCEQQPLFHPLTGEKLELQTI